MLEVFENVIFLSVISQKSTWMNTIVQFEHHNSNDGENETKQFIFIPKSSIDRNGGTILFLIQPSFSHRTYILGV